MPKSTFYAQWPFSEGFSFFSFSPAKQTGRQRIVAGVVGFCALQAGSGIAVAAPEKTCVVHPYVPARRTTAFLSLAWVFEWACFDSEQI